MTARTLGTKHIMTGNEGSVGNAEIFEGRVISLWLTLVVSTVIVALTAYVLSFALLGPNWTGAGRHTAAAAIHARS